MPADVVSHLGDGSSSAGIDHLNDYFKQISPSDRIRKSIADKYNKVPVRVANEEYKIDPATVTEIGSGNLGHGSKQLDKFVKNVRSHAHSNGLKLPPASKNIKEYLS